MLSLKEASVLLHLFAFVLCAVSKSNIIPPGYYAFEKAMKINGVPPRVRKPPYVPADIPCPGAVKTGQFSPRDTLCGDLNRGFVPLNPMKQAVAGQPYPFEIIKNKTLYFLAQTLPFLKNDINNIPKVAKLSPASFSNNHHLQRRSTDNTSSNFKSSFLQSMFNFTEARQKVCEHKDGILCQILQALTGGQTSSALMNSVNQAVQVLTAAQSAATTAQSLSSIAAILQQYSSGSGNPSSHGATGEQSNKSFVTQLLNLIASLNPSPNNNNNNNFSPLAAIIDYFSNGNSAVASSLLPARRKKPLDLEDIASETVVEQIPPTPCPSIEEYVAPVFARNYQGVWKYVVQIPNEGYFTQTVQKTSCVKNRCDFLEGVCHESPRWVSLLVAEIFYPQTHFPNIIASASSPKQHIVDYKHMDPHLSHLSELPLSDELFEQFINQYRSEETFGENTLMKPRHLKRVAKETKEARKNTAEEEKCDGHDKLGCYVVRVYHDWFLVPGSCKCWKKSSQSSLETLKKIFIGK
ncbi:hypothetical protein B4U79_08883 [Dinothrombium tinctorium]|uniref:Spaetzle domain-containing protein n=1 Tax=Dinothrombium tinctorium TaxID=1965070 RepID=A0A3S3S670_9ACAR|nr:hypothetical protein B4U79_08883 [Dinothrombium tinctorium]